MNLILLAIVAILVIWLILYLRLKLVQRNVQAKSTVLLEQSRGKVIQVRDKLTGRDLGVMKNRHFEILVPIFARETGDISSFYLLGEILPMLVKAENLPSDLVDYLEVILSDSAEADLEWNFQPRA